MIRPPGFTGAAFGTAADDDPRRDDDVRRRWAQSLGIGLEWAWMRQVHGTAVVEAEGPGALGEADAAFTRTPGLALAVATADCFPVIIEGEGGVGIAHAGWRGAAGGVVTALRTAMVAAGITPVRAAVGPGIEPCCFEVGGEVAARFPGGEAVTTWGTQSVDLGAAVRRELSGLEVWSAGTCTMSGDGLHSFRRDRTELRQVAVAWLPV